mmetsp:Transcript_23338/g.39874  ORF Transcript_23338/g.39874 Transcript_23338/m.39874 type:complete len:258 (-) Transcript_23338:226-999(-)
MGNILGQRRTVDPIFFHAAYSRQELSAISLTKFHLDVHWLGSASSQIEYFAPRHLYQGVPAVHSFHPFFYQLFSFHRGRILCGGWLLVLFGYTIQGITERTVYQHAAFAIGINQALLFDVVFDEGTAFRLGQEARSLSFVSLGIGSHDRIPVELKAVRYVPRHNVQIHDSQLRFLRSRSCPGHGQVSTAIGFHFFLPLSFESYQIWIVLNNSRKEGTLIFSVLTGTASYDAIGLHFFKEGSNLFVGCLLHIQPPRFS